MIRLIIALASLAVAQSALAATEWNCVNACRRGGFQWQYCVQQCSYDDNPYSQQRMQPQQPQQPEQLPRKQRARQTEWNCVNACTQRGFLRNYCVQQCSYGE
jgi:hypothetical protein